jgi:nucleoside-diphosphate-sugar epimerase
MANVLVTGGGGFIGSNLVRALLARGDDVRVLDNFATGSRGNLLEVWDEIELVEGDLRSYERVHAATRGAELVFHQGALPSVPRSVQDPLTTSAVNVEGTLNVLLAARDEDVRRVVYASSSSVYGDAQRLPTSEDALPHPLSPYGVTKLAAEQLCSLYHAEHGVAAVALRFFSVYGPRQRPDMAFHRFCRAALHGAPIELFGDGRQTRDFTYVGDVVGALRAAALAARAAGGVYNIGGGARVSLNRTLEVLAAVAGRPLDVRRQGRETGDVLHTGADIARARADLGYVPATGLEAGLRAELEWVALLGTERAQPVGLAR